MRQLLIEVAACFWSDASGCAAARHLGGSACTERVRSGRFAVRRPLQGLGGCVYGTGIRRHEKRTVFCAVRSRGNYSNTVFRISSVAPWWLVV